MKSFRHKFLFRAGLMLAILTGLGGGYYLVRYQAWAAYRNWSVRRMNVMARDFLAAGDGRSALLTVRKVLGKRPNDVEAWRLGAAAARQRDTAEAVYFQRNLRRVEPTPENQLELIRLALRYRMYQVALQAVTTASRETSTLAEYHRLAAEVYRLAGREVTSRYHLVSLLTMEPNDVPAQLALAELEFAGKGADVPADWPDRVARLVRQPGMELAATMLQLRYAVARQDVAAARPLVARLRDRIDLSLPQRLSVLEAVELGDHPAAEIFLGDLQRQVAAQPADAAQVMFWLARHGRGPLIVTWYATLPENSRADEIVKLFTARALEAQHDWAAAEQLLRGPRWAGEEAQRLVLLARAYQMMGRTADFAESWKLAVIAIGSDIRTGVRLLQTVSAWGWTNERYDVLWKIFALTPATRAVREELITREFLAGNTVNLNKIYARIIEATPDDDEARNNFAYTSLLLDTNLGRAQTIARDLHRKYPDNVAYLTTYTLALHKGGQSAEALALLDALSPGAQLEPSVMLHEATYAGATGQSKRAATLLPMLARARMLPEENQLVAATRLAVAKEGVRNERQQVLAAAAPASTTGGWLAWLPATARAASNDLRLADTYYRERNFAALRELARGASWKENEYLRQALLAYVSQQEDGGDAHRDAWRQAIGAAGRDGRRLQDLTVLAGHWNWDAERMEVTARRFEREAANTAMLAELLDFYRRQNRTADLARTLWLYVNETNSTGAEAASCVYYSLLCGMNVNSAQILAHRVYDAAPRAVPGRVAYAFALWRQRRAAEAWPLLQDIDPAQATSMQVPLLQAAVLLELGRKQEAQASLAHFVAVSAMPEERILADTLFSKVGLEGANLTLTTTDAPRRE